MFSFHVPCFSRLVSSIRAGKFERAAPGEAMGRRMRVDAAEPSVLLTLASRRWSKGRIGRQDANALFSQESNNEVGMTDGNGAASGEVSFTSKNVLLSDSLLMRAVWLGGMKCVSYSALVSFIASL